MAAAQQLRRAGHRVTLFERDEAVGGLVRFGVPDFKIEKTVVQRRVEQLLQPDRPARIRPRFRPERRERVVLLERVRAQELDPRGLLGAELAQAQLPLAVLRVLAIARGLGTDVLRPAQTHEQSRGAIARARALLKLLEGEQIVAALSGKAGVAARAPRGTGDQLGLFASNLPLSFHSNMATPLNT